MNSGELMSEGILLMLLGMGTVLVFLAILVLVTSLMSSLIQKYAPVHPSGHISSETAARHKSDHKLIAVISAAIHAHRSGK